MPPKRSHGSSTPQLDSADEKFMTTLLTTHINDRKEGVIVRASDPTAFPLVDAVSVAGAWKVNFPSRFSRYTKQNLEGVVSKVYQNLANEHKAATQPSPPSSIAQPTATTKRSIQMKPSSIVKKPKTNNSVLTSSGTQSVQLAPLSAGVSALAMANAVSGLSNSSNGMNSANGLFAPTPFDDDFSTQSGPKKTHQARTDTIDSVDIDLIDSGDSDFDDEMLAMFSGDELDLSSDDEGVFPQKDQNGHNATTMNDSSHTTAPDGEKSHSPNYYQNLPPATAGLVGQNSPIQPTLATSIRNQSNTNTSLNNLYNPNAVPYSQRVSVPDENTQLNGKPLTKRQQQDKMVREIQRDAKQNVPQHIKLKQRYKAYRDLSYGHREAEALARQELGMQFNPEFLPPGGVAAAQANNKKGGGQNSSKSGGDKTAKAAAPVVVPIRPTVSLKDVGGIDGIVQEIREIIEYPLTHPEIFAHLGVSPPKGVLLHGPPGSGKTLLANAIAGELGIPLIKVQATEIVSKLSGESENKIRTLFTDAAQHAPCIIFIDDIDVLAGKKDSEDGNDMKRRIVTQLIASIDGLGESAQQSEDEIQTDLDQSELAARQAMGNLTLDDNGNVTSKSKAEVAMDLNHDDDVMMKTALLNNSNSNKTIIVLGATSRLESIDTSLRRAGRFDREIGLGIPDEFARAQILKKMTAKMRLHNCNLDLIGKQTVGFVGADLLALTREAAVLSLNRIFTDEKAWAGSDFERFSISQGLIAGPNGSDCNQVQQLAVDLMSTMDDGQPSQSSTTDHNDAVNPSTLNPTAPLTKTQQHRLDLAQRTKISLYLRSSGPLSTDQLSQFAITHEDFSKAAKKVQPTAKREGFATVPETTWADVGALDLLRAELDMAIVQPIQEPELFEQLGLNTPAGVLLFGPPGCGKTLVAKAVANASGASFLSVKGPELLNQYVGESERAVRQVFSRAAMCAPCVIFFDEIDALVPRRGGSGGNQASERVVNQLLTELDGFDDRRQVFVIAATNRPDIIDPAVLRPGRLDKLLYLPLPDAEGRKSILMKHTRRTPFDYDNLPGSDQEHKREQLLQTVAFDNRSENYSGADMQALVREATTAALKEYQQKRSDLILAGGNPRTLVGSKVLVTPAHFDIAFGRVVASVNAKARKEYEQLCQTMTQGKGVLRKDVHTIQEGSQTGGASR